MDLRLEDIIQIYKDTLCLYNGVPVKVLDVNHDKRIRLFNLLTQRAHWVDFCFDKFSAPKGRLGYVNVMGFSFYLKRQPIRRFSNGVTRNNLIIVNNEGVGGENCRYAQDLISERTHPSFISAMFGEYPTKEDALDMLKKGDTSVAFDRQFAYTKLADSTVLHYKGKYVGDVLDGEVTFRPKFEYLEGLLESGYGKTVV